MWEHKLWCDKQTALTETAKDNNKKNTLPLHVNAKCFFPGIPLISGFFKCSTMLKDAKPFIMCHDT